MTVEWVSGSYLCHRHSPVLQSTQVLWKHLDASVWNGPGNDYCLLAQVTCYWAVVTRTTMSITSNPITMKFYNENLTNLTVSAILSQWSTHSKQHWLPKQQNLGSPWEFAVMKLELCRQTPILPFRRQEASWIHLVVDTENLSIVFHVFIEWS